MEIKIEKYLITNESGTAYANGEYVSDTITLAEFYPTKEDALAELSDIKLYQHPEELENDLMKLPKEYQRKQYRKWEELYLSLDRVVQIVFEVVE